MKAKQLKFNFRVYTRICKTCGSTVTHKSNYAKNKAKKHSKYCLNCWDVINGCLKEEYTKKHKQKSQAKPLKEEFVNQYKVDLKYEWKLVNNKWIKASSICGQPQT